MRVPLTVFTLLALAGLSLPGAALDAPTARPVWTQVASSSSFAGTAAFPAGRCTLVLNDCEACALEVDGRATCSSPGIACTPTEWRCMRFGTAGSPPHSPLTPNPSP